MRNEMSLGLLEDGDFSRSITKMSWRYWRRLKAEDGDGDDRDEKMEE
jgi:hypothetical protein